MIKVLLIDLDGVLRIWNSERDRQAEQAAGLPAGAILRAAFSPELLQPVITGQISDEVWRQQVTGHLRLQFPQADAEKAVQLWSASPGEVNLEVLEVVRACRRNASTVLITNATSRLPLDLQQLNLAGEFDQIVNSSVVGWTKPQAEIFSAALELAGVTAAEAFFVDDTPDHVVAAAQMGIGGHVYRRVDQLREVLVRHGLL